MDQHSANTYLNTAATGLLEPQVIDAANKFYAQLSVHGSNFAEQWRMEEEPHVRATIASFVGAQPRNIAMVPNFSWALNGLVQSLKGTEKIMLYRHDYPSLTEPFKINNFSIKWIDTEDGFTLPVEQIKQSIANKEIDILAISHVQYNTGYKLDIEEIGVLCNVHNVLFIVDATQSLGAIETNLGRLQADVFIASNYKWMNAGFGTGIMYMSDIFLEKYTPVVGGNNSYKNHEGTMMYLPSVQSYEPGHPNMGGLTILQAAIRHKMQLGIENVEKHNHRLAALLLDEIKELPVQLIGPYTMTDRAPMILLKDEDGLSAWLKQHNIVTTNRNGIVRISTHYHNTNADVIQLVNCLYRKYG